MSMVFSDKGAEFRENLKRYIKTRFSSTRGNQSFVYLAIVISILLLTSAIVLHTLYISVRDISPYPYWDMVAVHLYYFEGSFESFFFFRDNEHLPFFVMPVFLLDSILFEARGYFLVIGILFLNFGIVALIILELRSAWEKFDGALLLGAAMVFLLLFWLLHYENFTWPKQIHMYMSSAFALLAMHKITNLEVSRSDGASIRLREPIVIALLLTLATFSFAYGAIGWVAALLLAVSKRWPARVTIIILCGFCANMFVYYVFYNMNTLAAHSNPIQSLLEPLKVLEYIIFYFASPFIELFKQITSASLARSLGFAISSAGVAFALVAIGSILFLRRKPSERAEIFGLLLVLFALGAAGMTALSRLRFGVDQSLASRYAIIQVLFWIGIILVIASLLRTRLKLRMLSFIVFGGCLVLLVVPSQMRFERLSAARLENQWNGILAIINGTEANQVIKTSIFPDPNISAVVARHLAARGWSIFAQPQPWWIGRSVSWLP